MSIVDDMLQHAAEDPLQEVCGLVVSYGKHCRVLRGENISPEPRVRFQLGDQVWLQVGESEEVVAIYHSHPNGNPEPSMADRTACEASRLPWYIVGTGTGAFIRLEPSGYRAPVLGRPYVYGVHDCWSVVRDWYQETWQLDLPDFARDDEWWLKGQNLFLENFQSCGFEDVGDSPFQAGDAVLIQVRSPVPNHVAVWLGDGTILHHPTGRLSSRDPWAGYWVKHCSNHLRHITKMGMSSG